MSNAAIENHIATKSTVAASKTIERIKTANHTKPMLRIKHYQLLLSNQLLTFDLYYSNLLEIS